MRFLGAAGLGYSGFTRYGGPRTAARRERTEADRLQRVGPTIGDPMPSFANPYGGEVPSGTMSNGELAQAIRLDLASELEAIFLYDAHVMHTDDKLAKQVLGEIRDEEMEHVGELLVLLQYLDPHASQHYSSGIDEVDEKIEKLGILSDAGD